MAKNLLKPTAHQTFRIDYVDSLKGDGVDFGAELERSHKAEGQGRYEEACEIRFAAVQQLVDLLPEDEPVELDWEDEATQQAMELLYLSAVDFFLVSDWEMAAAQLEMLLDVDSEDHLEATRLLAYTYVAMGEFESFDEIVNDISDKSPDRAILLLWSEFRRSGCLPEGELMRMRRNFGPYLKEFTAESHNVNEWYLGQIGSERPSKEALARELWLQTEHLWAQNEDFIEALRKA